MPRLVPDYVISGVGEKYGNLIVGNAYKVAERIAEEADAYRRTQGVFTMNRCFILCVLAATFVCLHAAPRLARSDLPGNGGSGIWSDCSEFMFSSEHHLL